MVNINTINQIATTRSKQNEKHSFRLLPSSSYLADFPLVSAQYPAERYEILPVDSGSAAGPR